MRSALGLIRISIALLGVALLGSAGALTDHRANAAEAVDSITTGALGKTSARAETRGSVAFRRALAMLTSGDEVGAYRMAMGFDNDIERRTIQWAAIYFGNGAIDHATVLRFEKDAPEWASAGLYRTRLEQALVKERAPASEVIELLGGRMPNTIGGQIALAAAYKQGGQTARAARIARSIWTEHVLDRASQDKVLKQLGDLLDRSDHWDRAVHLLMTDHARDTERLLDYLSPAEKSLANAGIAVIRGAAQARPLLDRVDPSLRHDPLFYFLSAQQARVERRYGTAIADLDTQTADAPDPSEWWQERRSLIRELLNKGEVKLAYEAAAGYRHGSERSRLEAHFTAGWIALSFLHDPRTARQQFEDMRKLATIPDSISKAEYWLARALAGEGEKASARKALAEGAKYQTSYYGLLARAELGIKGVDLRPMPPWRTSEATFNSRDLTMAVRLLMANGQSDMAVPLLRHLASGLKDGGELVLAARLAQDLNAHQLAISIAQMADDRGAPLDLFSFPRDGVPSDAKLASIDKAFIYAVARQESHFKVDAVSSAGARGIMQLMPATAKETAQYIGVPYSPAKLTTDAAYNLRLGSTYLARQLDRFDGSLVLAAAAYNAGPGNVTKWLAAYGDPRASNVDTVLWVELIPISETRHYVQRVLANYVVYRQRLGRGDISILAALKRIPD